MGAPDWSWLGLIFMLLLLLALLTVLEYVRVAGRQEFKAGKHEDEVMQLIGAVGYKVRVRISSGCMYTEEFADNDAWCVCCRSTWQLLVLLLL